MARGGRCSRAGLRQHPARPHRQHCVQGRDTPTGPIRAASRVSLAAHWATVGAGSRMPVAVAEQVSAVCRWLCRFTPLGAAWPPTAKWLLRQDSDSAGVFGPAQVTRPASAFRPPRRRRRRTRVHAEAQLRVDRQPRADRRRRERLEIGEERGSGGPTAVTCSCAIAYTRSRRPGRRGVRRLRRQPPRLRPAW
jgi:hypothetical protein